MCHRQSFVTRRATGCHCAMTEACAHQRGHLIVRSPLVVLAPSPLVHGKHHGSMDHDHPTVFNLSYVIDSEDGDSWGPDSDFNTTAMALPTDLPEPVLTNHTMLHNRESMVPAWLFSAGVRHQHRRAALTTRTMVSAAASWYSTAMPKMAREKRTIGKDSRV